MARLRQLNPQNYPSSSNINAEFESVVRYINAAELGNKTVGELLATLFDENGDFDGPIEMRRLTGTGIQFRAGEFDSAEEGWTTLITDADMRGASGVNLGDIGAPIFHARQDTTATASQTVFSYAHASTDTLVVFLDGALQVPGGSNDYTNDAAADTVTFNSAMSGGEVVTIFKVRADTITGFTRSDIVSTAGQVVFAFVHDENSVLQVYVNGILQREGGANDYTTSPSANTVTFTSGLLLNDVVSIITVENTSNQAVTGLMLEGNYTDTATGLIPYAKLLIADGDITQAKVSGLVAALAAAPKMTVSGTTPVSPAVSDLWLDTSASPNILKVYDGVQFLSLNAEADVPSFAAANANQFLQVNGTGTSLQFANVDFSSLVPKTYMGAANGVPTLDSGALIPSAQLPTILTGITLPLAVGGTVTNTTVLVQRIYKQKIRIDGVTHKLSAGTCTIQLSVDGSTVGTTHGVSSTATDANLSPSIEVDATSSSKRIEVVITGVSSAADLEVGIACVTEDT